MSEEKITMPLTIETKFGEFRLKPLQRFSNGQDFEVKFKFYDPLTLLHESMFGVKDLKDFIKRNCVVLFREAGEKLT